MSDHIHPQTLPSNAFVCVQHGCNLNVFQLRMGHARVVAMNVPQTHQRKMKVLHVWELMVTAVKSQGKRDIANFTTTTHPWGCVSLLSGSLAAGLAKGNCRDSVTVLQG